MNSQFNWDRLTNLNPSTVGGHCIAIIDKLSDHPPEQQVAAVAVAFLSLLRLTGQHAGSVLEVANNLLTNASHKTPSLKALLQYSKENL